MTHAAVDDNIEHGSAADEAGPEPKAHHDGSAHETILMIAAPVSLLVSLWKF